MHIDFLRLLFLVGVICPLMQEHSLRLKKLISQVPEAAMFKIRRPVYKRFINLNQIACYVVCYTAVLRADQKKGSNLSTVSVLANGGLHQDLMHRGCYGTTPGERRSQMFVYKLSPFPFPPPSLSSRFFHPIPKQRAFSQATLSCMDRVLRLRNRQGSKAHVFRHDRRGFKRFINRT